MSAPHRQPPSNFMIKYAVISLELMDHYSRFWAARPPRDKEEEAERAERLMTVFRQMFVASMSALEFSAKLVLHGYPTSPVTTRIENLKDQRRNRRVYLSDIVNITQGLGLITSIEKDYWEAILTVRNIVVHNNGISDIDADYQVGPVRVELKKSQMTRGRSGQEVRLAFLGGRSNW